MCGISGIIHADHQDIIVPMTDAIAHRGPDDFGYFSGANISFGHRRLAIQDLSTNGHQPMFTKDGRYCIVFNGEIYNHNDIRERLTDKYQFVSHSDTETILYGFVEYGVKIFNQLNGIFALAIYDNKTNEVILARDQFGVKPLYYYHKDNNFLFSSEIKSFLAFDNFSKDIDPKGLWQYIRFLWSPGERTGFKFVKKLLPGHYLKINSLHPAHVENIQYYTIPFDGKYENKSEKEWIDALENQLYHAVKRQLLSDVPVGYFLSGGLDSSAIVAMAKKILPDQQLHCYTIDSGSRDQEEEGFSDDLYYAKKVAKHLGVNLHIIQGKEDILGDLDKMIWQLDEPQGDAAPIHVLNICTQARKDGFVVLLGGTAGDDVFSGYRRHQALFYEKVLRYIPGWVVSTAKSILDNIKSTNPKIRRIKKLFAEQGNTRVDRALGYFSWITPEHSKKLFSKKYADELNLFDSMEVLKNTYHGIPEEPSMLNKMLHLEMKHFLPDHNLNYTDKLSMAVGVEVRVPFLDKELVEFSTRIPPELKMKGTTTKYLLKKVMEKYLPHDVVYRPKAGFGAPVRSWIDKILKLEKNNYFGKEALNSIGIFDYESVETLIQNTRAKKIDGIYNLLSILCIKAWYNQFIK